MKKPITRIALVIWALAAGILAFYVFYDLDTLHATILTQASYHGDARAIAFYNPYAPLTHEVGTDIFRIALLVAVGAIVELIDQIRWNAIQAGKSKL